MKKTNLSAASASNAPAPPTASPWSNQNTKMDSPHPQHPHPVQTPILHSPQPPHYHFRHHVMASPSMYHFQDSFPHSHPHYHAHHQSRQNRRRPRRRNR